MWTKEIVSLLIEAYKAHECLYNVKSTRYKNKHLRAEALKDIVACLKPLVSVTEEEVKTKISNLRTVFLSEHGKYKRSISSGAGVDDLYKPTLWYYEEMNFLVESSIPREGISNMRCEENIRDQEEVMMFLEDNINEDRGSPTPSSSSSPRTVTPIIPRGQQKKRKRESDHDNSATPLAVKGLHDIGLFVQGLVAERKEKENNHNVHLTRYIQSKLESYSDPNLRLEVEQKIIQVLFEADVKASLMRECDTSQ